MCNTTVVLDTALMCDTTIVLHTTLMCYTAVVLATTLIILAHTLAMSSLATTLVHVVAQPMHIELFPAPDPRAVAPHSMGIISTVPVATASPQRNMHTAGSDSSELLPASDPWTVAPDPVTFVSTPLVTTASSESNSPAISQRSRISPAALDTALMPNTTVVLDTALMCNTTVVL